MEERVRLQGVDRGCIAGIEELARECKPVDLVRDRPHWKAVFVVMVRLSTDCKEQNLGPDIFWFHRKVD